MVTIVWKEQRCRRHFLKSVPNWVVEVSSKGKLAEDVCAQTSCTSMFCIDCKCSFCNTRFSQSWNVDTRYAFSVHNLCTLTTSRWELGAHHSFNSRWSRWPYIQRCKTWLWRHFVVFAARGTSRLCISGNQRDPDQLKSYIYWWSAFLAPRWTRYLFCDCAAFPNFAFADVTVRSNSSEWSVRVHSEFLKAACLRLEVWHWIGATCLAVGRYNVTTTSYTWTDLGSSLKLIGSVLGLEIYGSVLIVAGMFSSVMGSGQPEILVFFNTITKEVALSGLYSSNVVSVSILCISFWRSLGAVVVDESLVLLSIWLMSKI